MNDGLLRPKSINFIESGYYSEFLTGSILEQLTTNKKPEFCSGFLRTLRFLLCYNNECIVHFLTFYEGDGSRYKIFKTGD
jgi:hypothetical protein